VLNKVDLPAADVKSCTEQMVELLGIEPEEILRISAKTGEGVEELLHKVIELVPPPEVSRASQREQSVGGQKTEDGSRTTDHGSRLKWLVFDSSYDVYRGVVVYGRVFSGVIKSGDTIEFMSNGLKFEIIELGVFTPKMKPIKQLGPGEVGYFTAAIKDAANVKVGDTVTHNRHPAEVPLPGFKECHPMVFSGLYPVDASDYEEFQRALARLKLNDASFVYEQENSIALGFGFRCGFLGLLHMEIIQERLDREFNMNLIATSPSVIYQVLLKNGEIKEIDNPLHLPDISEIDEIDEPYVDAFVVTPVDRIGAVMQLALDRRGEMKTTESLDSKRVILHFEIPLNEIIIDFYDKIKSATSGYGSLDYEHIGFRKSDLVKLDILLNGEPVDAFSTIVHRDRAYHRGRALAEKLKEVIPPQQFAVAIQAAIGGKVIARETVRALRKDVTAKCYGGDVSRKRKLLEKQKAGKKRMKQVGKVNIPQKAFLEILRA